MSRSPAGSSCAQSRQERMSSQAHISRISHVPSNDFAYHSESYWKLCKPFNIGVGGEKSKGEMES